MPHKGNVAVVLFNPSLACIEQILEFISVFKHTSSELHILSDQENTEHTTKQEDLLVLELSLPRKISDQLLQYINQLYPGVNAFIIDQSKTDGNKKTILSVKEDLQQRTFLKNHKISLN